jgi:hypothetical protein
MKHFWTVVVGVELAVAAALIGAPLLQNVARGETALAEVGQGKAMRAFASRAELDALLKKRESRSVQALAVEEVAADASALEADTAAAPAADAAAAPAEPPPAGKSSDAITNTQTAGVDEGGIVKKQGDLLIVLRRGRLFTIDTSGGGMRKVAAVNAFPGAQDASEAWYDEMLVSDDQVIVIGYSYVRQGTEVNRFRLSPDGGLKWRDTHYLRSGDYYSSRNYASRLIGDKLIFYAPLPLYNGIDEAFPALAAWQGNGRVSDFRTFAEASDIYMPAPMWDDSRRVGDVLHSVMICDVGDGAMDCDATNVLGDWSRSFYVSQQAVYVWTGFDPPGEYRTNAAMLYRIPLDGGAPLAAQVAGMPIDQFSFNETVDGTLNVLTMAEGSGDAMWGPEAVEEGDMALLTLDPSAFSDGGQGAESGDYRPLPEVAGYEKQNRFVGDWLLYASGHVYHDLRKPKKLQPTLYAVPVKGGAPVALSPGHGVTRIDIMGRDAIAIGEDDRGALTFSTVALDGNARLAARYAFPDVGEGENRSHAFFYRPDAGGNGDSGYLGLPIQRSGGDGTRFLGNAASILFLRRDDRVLGEAGLLDARAGDGEDNCLASCTDWYGNARPIFFGDRLFALMGYELVEGRVAGKRVTEKARLNFTPGPQNR